MRNSIANPRFSTRAFSMAKPMLLGVALVLAAINGADRNDRCTIAAPFAFDAGASITGLKLGYLPEAFGEGATAVDHAALAAVTGSPRASSNVAMGSHPFGHSFFARSLSLNF